MKKIFPRFLALLLWFTLILQFPLTVHHALENGLTFFDGVLRYFGYFTILTNLFLALTLSWPFLAPETKIGKFFASNSTRSGALVYIFIVAVIYHLLLRKLWNPQGAVLFADTLLHTVNPILYFVFWLTQVPKRTLQIKHPGEWLIFPLVYASYTLAHGAYSGYYPYPFLDANVLGYPRVGLTCIAFVFIFWMVGLVVYRGDRSFPLRSDVSI